MKKIYSVQFEKQGQIISDFKIEADNLKEAKGHAQFHKRHLSVEDSKVTGTDRIKTTVRFSNFSNQ